MTTRTRWLTAVGLLLGLMAISCGALPPIEIVIPPPANQTPAEPTPEPAPEPPVVEPAPEPEPERPWLNLNIVVHDAAGVGIPGAACVILGDRRVADGQGFINYAVQGSSRAACGAIGYVPVERELPPGDHRIGLAKVELPPAPKPEPKPQVPSPKPEPGALCAERVSAPLECVRQVAAAFPDLLTTNTYESCLEFTQRVLAVLGPDYGHVAKTAGESQSVPPGFEPRQVGNYWITGVSHDAIKHRVTGQVVDLLGNASANSDPDPKIHGPASPQWNLIPAQYWRESNPFIPAVPVR